MKALVYKGPKILQSKKFPFPKSANLTHSSKFVQAVSAEAIPTDILAERAEGLPA